MPSCRIAALSFLLVFAILITAGSVAARTIGAVHQGPELRAKKTCTLKKKAKCKKTTVSKQKIGKQNLSGANLSGAVITGSTFTGTNLTNVDLSNAKLTNVTFKNTDLGGVNLTGATLVNVRFDHVDASAGSSARACEFISGSGNVDGCELPGFVADGVTIQDTFITNSNFARSSWKNATFDNAMFVNCTLDDARFDGADFGMRDKIGIAGILSRPQANAQRARFDNSKHLQLFHVNVEKGSFLGATNFKHVDSTLTDARGLQGSRTVTVSRTPGFSLEPLTIQINESGYWRIGNLCRYAITCSYEAAVGSPIQIAVRSVIPFSVSGPGLTCTRSVVTKLSLTTCVVNSLPAGSDPLAVTFGPFDPSPPPAPAVVTKTVTVNISPLVPGQTPDVLKIVNLTDNTSTVCNGALTCMHAYPVNSSIQILLGGNVAGGSPIVGTCPGETLLFTSVMSPFEPYACPAFTLTADTTMNADLS